MTNKNLIALAATAVVLGAAAYLATSTTSTKRSPRLNGTAVLPDLDVSAVAAVEFGDKLKLASGADGWKAAASFWTTCRPTPSPRSRFSRDPSWHSLTA